jgi:hypothetical protein
MQAINYAAGSDPRSCRRIVAKYPHFTHRPSESRCRTAERVPLIMDETYLQCPGSRPAEGSIAADVLLREEPEEEEEDEDEQDDEEEDDDGDEGYSE